MRVHTYICVVRDAVRRVKGAPRFPYANYQGDIRPAKITVENNVIDWEDELARARIRVRTARNGQYIVGPAITEDH